MTLHGPRRRITAITAAAACALLGAASGPAVHAAGTAPATVVRAHQLFDQSDLPAPHDVAPGARPIPLRPRVRASGANAAAASSAPPAEVLGFAQSGEVIGGYWQQDLQFNLLSTVAYFSIDVNGDGTLNTAESGYAGWTSAQMTSLMDTAHSDGVRVVLTITAFDDGTIGSVTGSEANRQQLVSQVVNQVMQRNADGVNVDFEGLSGSLSSGYTTFISELRSGLNSRAAGHSYLTIDTYASAAQGGTMYDIPALKPYVDAFDAMAYDFTTASSSSAGPVAPLNGWSFNDTETVQQFLQVVPPSQLILGVPYYGYKWSVTSPAPRAQVQPGTTGSGDTYSGILADFSCALQQSHNYDSTYQEPWATWWSPASGDPCGGNHNSWRELYYDNAQSLSAKYQLVNANHVRGIGIWALGMDSGTNDLWNAIAASFSVAHGPTAHVVPLQSQTNTAQFTVSWAPDPGSAPASMYTIWAQTDAWGWVPWLTVPAGSGGATFFAWPGHTYAFYAQPSGGSPPAPSTGGQAMTSVPSSVRSPLPFTSLYAVNDAGTLDAASSPPLAPASLDGVPARGIDSWGQGGQVADATGALHAFGAAPAASGESVWPGADIARGVTLSGAAAGYTVDAFGGVHPFGGTPEVAVTSYWPNWDIARGIAVRPDGRSGYVLDGWGGLHPFGAAPAVTITGYWSGWDIARGLVLRPDGQSGFVLDGFGGLHPFGVSGDVPAVPSGFSYWSGFDIARGVALLPGSGGAGYTVDGYGGMHPFGGAPQVTVFGYHAGADTIRGMAAS